MCYAVSRSPTALLIGCSNFRPCNHYFLKIIYLISCFTSAEWLKVPESFKQSINNIKSPATQESHHIYFAWHSISWMQCTLSTHINWAKSKFKNNRTFPHYMWVCSFPLHFSLSQEQGNNMPDMLNLIIGMFYQCYSSMNHILYTSWPAK